MLHKQTGGSRRSRPWPVPRLAVALSAVLGLLVVGLPAPAAAEPAADRLEDGGAVTVDQAVTGELAAHGTADFWIGFAGRADLSGAYEITHWAERGRYVYDRLTRVANASQAGLRAELGARGADFEPLWIVNAILVRGGDRAILDAARTASGVTEIRSPRTVELPEPIRAEEPDQARVNAVEWGISNIRADQVWSGFGVRGEGVVVGNIDTGVAYDHPALVDQYRGNLGDGTFDHNYNWWDPSLVCLIGSPCDNNSHGTHTMGTMVGDDDGDNQIGVAPGAEWIAAKGCETNFCSDLALLSSGQFMLAPTDQAGENPRPDLRPHVVNNSWGGPGGDGWYDPVVDAWTAAGMVGVFSNGNSGPGCNTAGSPADGPNAWAVGAYDIDNEVAFFSSRGPGRGQIRPHIAAPGVDVRSSLPSGRYGRKSGTSMAAPHQSGTVALMWSAAPDLFGDAATTRAILASTAVDVDDTSCGGEPGNNNVWGEGRLDAFAAVEGSPRGPVGTLAGTITAAETGEPVGGATVSLEVNGQPRSVFSDADGSYLLSVPAGSYSVTARAFGFDSVTKPAEVVVGQTTTLDFPLPPVPTHPVSGTVTNDAGAPVAGATVRIEDTPLPPVVTGEDGRWSFEAVAEGQYEMTVSNDHGCLAEASVDLVVDEPEVVDVPLGRKADTFGHTCRVVASEYVEATEPFDPGFMSVARIDLPFPFPFYGSSYDAAYIGLNGYLEFQGPGTAPDGFLPSPNTAIPTPQRPNAAIYGFWDNLVTLPSGSPVRTDIRTSTRGSDGNRQFVVEWQMSSIHDWAVEIVLHETGDFVLEYRGIDPDDGLERGDSATVGIENANGTDALQYSVDLPVLSDEQAVRFSPPAGGQLTGTVTDANDSQPLAGAAVTATSERPTGTVITGTATSAADGSYLIWLPVGTSSVQFGADRYTSETREPIAVGDGQEIALDIPLRTGVATVGTDQIDITVPAGGQHTIRLSLTNTGSANLDWDAHEARVRAGTTSDPGAVLASWPAPMGENDRRISGIGYDGDHVWTGVLRTTRLLPDANRELTVDGTPTGVEHPTDWIGDESSDWPAGMAFDANRGWMCQMVMRGTLLGRDSAIYCWDPATGEVQATITGSPWSGPRFGWGQLGLAYDPDTDTFYLGGDWDRTIFHVAGLSHETPGRVLGECYPDPAQIHDLAYNSLYDVLWMTASAGGLSTNPHSIYQLDPVDCSTLDTQPFPSEPGNQSGPWGPALDEFGDLWVGNNRNNQVSLVHSGMPVAGEVPWLEVNPLAGRLAPGRGQQVEVIVDATGLEPGVYPAEAVLATSAGRQPIVSIPVRIEVRPISFEDVRQLVEEFRADGQVTGVGASRLLATLRLAERHHERGADTRAIQDLERFQQLAADPRLVPGAAARDALIAAVEQLIAHLRDDGGAATIAGSVPAPDTLPTTPNHGDLAAGARAAQLRSANE